MTPSEQIQILSKSTTSFKDVLQKYNTTLKPRTLNVFQVNIGKTCNQACKHCHVEAGPNRTEQMSLEIIDLCIEAIKNNESIQFVDITGGAPEMNPHFKYFVTEIVKLGRHVMDRCNLTILEEPGYEYLYEFLAKNKVEIIASLPHYEITNVDKQRGTGVYETSITALKKLNALGYGTNLPLNLVYNPVGSYLVSDQKSIEADFKNQLKTKHTIIFNSLYCLNNMPISRYLEALLRTNKFDTYMQTLLSNFNIATVNNLMCRDMISVAWDGYLYDCDFNQMLDLKIDNNSHISSFSTKNLLERSIQINNHCFGCTAGSGSSCGGVLT